MEIWISKLLVLKMVLRALQMDIKIDGITKEILQEALAQAQSRTCSNHGLIC